MKFPNPIEDTARDPSLSEHTIHVSFIGWFVGPTNYKNKIPHATLRVEGPQSPSIEGVDSGSLTRLLCCPIYKGFKRACEDN